MNIEPNITLSSAILLLGSVNSALISIFLLFFQKSNARTNRYLAFILLFLGMDLFHQFLIDSNYIYQLQPIIGFFMQFEVLFGPLLYLYIRDLTNPDAVQSDRKNMLHLLPAVFGIFLMIPFYILGFKEKLEFIQHGYNSDNLTNIAGITTPAYMIIGTLSFTLYLGFSIKLFFAHRKKIANYFSYREKITLDWLRNIFIVMVIYWLFMAAYIALMDSTELNKQIIDVLMLFTVAAVHYLGIKGLLQPKVYSRKKQTQSIRTLLDIENRPQPSPIELEKNTVKYIKSALSDEDSERIINRLKSVVKEDKPYLDSCLTLPDLAEKISVSSNYLSQVINERLGMNFFDYINSHRIEMAKHLLLNPLPHTPTILDIAMESAFNSKSAFYTAFKKHTGLTPAQYKKKGATRDNT